MKVLIVLAFCFVLATAEYTEFTEEERQFFKEWIIKYGKQYDSKEKEEQALKNLMESKRECDEHNLRHDRGEVGYRRGVWEHSDLSKEDKEKFLLGYTPPQEFSEAYHTAGFNYYPPGPESVNWTERGLVAEFVRDQRKCGSCWAFSTVEVVQAVMRKKNITDLLSPQQLIDCSEENDGCGGGKPDRGLEYVKNHGLTTMKKYPYTQHTGTCKYHPKEKIGEVSKVYYIPTRGNETWLKDITASVGPVNIALCVNHAFKDYQSGVFDDVDCCKGRKRPNHAPTLTGYGTDPIYGDYWLVKNSWGTSFGENGYIRIARNKNNLCMISHFAVYAE